MDLIKELESGLFCTHKCGNSREREAHAKHMIDVLESGVVKREIRNAPRDARYKIDWYFKDGVEPSTETIDYDNLNFHKDTLRFLSMDESFNPSEIKTAKSVEVGNGFELCYGRKECGNIMNNGKKYFTTGYYFKYNGEPCRLIFSYSPKLVDYSSSFWGKYKGYVNVFDSFSEMMHNIGYFIAYHKIK